MARILYEILSGVVLNLIYMSMYSDGLKLTPVTYNPIVGEPFDLVCDTEVTIISTVTITAPDDILAGSCTPALSPFPAGCSDTANYNTTWDEAAHTVTIKTSSLASNYNGTWKCTHDSVTGTYNLVNREIKDESFTLFPTSFTENITSETTSISLSATYGCTDFKVYFKWFVVDSASKKIDIDIEGTNNVAENSSVCTSGFNGYTETKKVNEEVYSSNYVKDLNGSYRLGVEVHYTDEVTRLHSIKYFDTYFVFSSAGTNTSTKEYGRAFVILSVCLFVAYLSVASCAVFSFPESTKHTSGNCFLTFRQFIKGKCFDCCGNKLSQESEGDPGFFKDTVCTLNSLLGFAYLVLYGIIVEVIVLLAVYYGDAKFQEGLVIGVGIVIVLVLSFMCLLVVAWLLMEFVYTSASERSSSLRCIRNGTVTPQHESCTRNGTITPHETGKSQKRATIDKRGPQSTPKETDARVICL